LLISVALRRVKQKPIMCVCVCVLWITVSLLALQTAIGTEGGDVLIDSIHSVISQLVEQLRSLPLPLVVLFHSMQDLTQDTSDVGHSSKSVALKVLSRLWPFCFALYQCCWLCPAEHLTSGAKFSIVRKVFLSFS